MQAPTAPGRRARRLPLRAWTIAISLVLFLWGGTAAAQIAIGTFSRAISHENYPYWISRADCLNDADIFRFPLTLTSAVANTYYLEVWVSDGSDCTSYMSRNPNQAPVCKRLEGVAGGTIQSTSQEIRLTSKQIATARLALVGAQGAEECTDTLNTKDGRPTKIWFLLLKGAQDDVAGGFAASFPTASVTGGMSLDLAAPDPPTNVGVTSSEAALTVEFDGTPGGGDIAGYYLYCDPPPNAGSDSSGGCGCGAIGSSGGGSGGTTTTASKTTTTTTTAASPAPPGGGVGGAGGKGSGGEGGGGGEGGSTTSSSTTSETATGTDTGTATGTDTGTATGTDTGTATDTATDTETETTEVCTSQPTEGASCGSCVLVPGDIPSDAYRCGEISGSGEQGTAAVLENGVTHAVGVAAFDLRGNVGKLSGLACGTPAPVSDFYESYKEAGGKGGGGCSVPSRFRSMSAAAPLLVLGASIALGLRRRRRIAASRRAGGSR